jgi:hypothetical protein
MTDTPYEPGRRAAPVLVRRILAGAAALVLTTVALAGLAATPASAAPPNCPAGALCIYPDPGYSGGLGTLYGNNPDFTRLPTSTHNCGNGTWDNCVSSAFNNGTQCTVYLFSGYSYTGVKHTLSRGDGYYNFHDVGFDDTLSSNRWCS